MLKRGKKAQSAMEYLLTYGWAILIILISLSLLFYLGVFSPSTPNTCMGTPPLVCSDVKVVHDLKPMDATPNTIGGVAIFSVGVSGITAPDIKSVTLNGKECHIDSGYIDWSGSDMVTFACSVDLDDIDLNVGDKASGEFSFEYESYGGLTHTIQASFSGTVEEIETSCSLDEDCFGYEGNFLLMIGCHISGGVGGVSCVGSECLYYCDYS